MVLAKKNLEPKKNVQSKLKKCVLSEQEAIRYLTTVIFKS